MKKALLIGVFSISLLAPGLFAAGDAKLSGGVTKTLTGKTTSLVQDMKRLVVPFLALTAAYKIVIEPASVVAYKKVGNVLAKSNNYKSWIARPFQLMSSLWNLFIPQRKSIDLSQFATRTYVDSKLGVGTQNLSHYVTQAELQQSVGRLDSQRIIPLIAKVDALEKVHNVEQLRASVQRITDKMADLERQVQEINLGYEEEEDDSQEYTSTPLNEQD